MKNQKIICIIAAVALMVTAVFCGYRIYSHYAQVDEQTEVFDELAAVVESTPIEEMQADNTPVSEGENVLAKYKELYLQNEDMAGWISIDGTTINYPIMRSVNEPNFYLKHNFEKGCNFVSKNTILITKNQRRCTCQQILDTKYKK